MSYAASLAVCAFHSSKPGVPAGHSAAEGALVPPSLVTPLVTWAGVPGCGRGLIAAADIAAGTVVETAPAVPVDEHQDDLVRQYLFVVRGDRAEPVTASGRFAIVFGPMALCNHAEASNACVSFRRDERRGLEARLTAARDIRKGEEITISYADCGWYERTGRI